MIVEFIVGRTWRIQIDGMKPAHEWEIGEEEEHQISYTHSQAEGDGHDETHFRYACSKLVIRSPLPGSSSAIEVEWFAFDVEREEWGMDIDAERSWIHPLDVWIKFKGEAEPIHLDVTDYFWLYRNEGPAPRGIKTESGEWVEIDETQCYVRAETKEAQ